MADDDAAVLRLLGPFKNLGEEAIQNLARMSRERPDSFENIIHIGRQDATTVDNIIRMGRQDKLTLDNIIMLGVEPKETLGTMIQGARDRQNADRWDKFRWQLASRWLMVLGGIGTLYGLGQGIPLLIGLFKKWTNQ